MAQPPDAGSGTPLAGPREHALHGELGVLAYDELADRIQCHACGGWYQRLTLWHLRRHGLDAWSYKEEFGLNVTTPLQSRRLEGVQRRLLEERVAKGILTMDPPTPVPGPGTKHRAQYFRTHQTPEARRAAGHLRRRWTDEELLADLRALQADCGGTLTLYYLRKHRPIADAAVPGRSTLMARFGSWRRICEILGQAHHPRGWHQAHPGVRKWSDEAILERLRRLRVQHGGTLTVRALAHTAARDPDHLDAIPSYKTVRDRFGSWQHLLERLDAPLAPESGTGTALARSGSEGRRDGPVPEPRTPQERAAAGRRQLWSEEEMLAALRGLQAERGGIVTRCDLRLLRPDGRGIIPSESTVIARFGSWHRVCELLGQPYRRARRPRPPGAERRWTDAAMLAALRNVRAEAGGVLTARHLFLLRSGGKGKPGTFPSYKTVLARFGTWDRVLALLDEQSTPP